MKRLATGTFVLFYTALAVFLTVDRTFTWAAARAESSKPRAAELWHHSPHESQTRMLEEGFVICLNQDISIPSIAEENLRQVSSASVVTQNDRPISSRAPPSLL